MPDLPTGGMLVLTLMTCVLAWSFVWGAWYRRKQSQVGKSKVEGQRPSDSSDL